MLCMCFPKRETERDDMREGYRGKGDWGRKKKTGGYERRVFISLQKHSPHRPKTMTEFFGGMAGREERLCDQTQRNSYVWVGRKWNSGSRYGLKGGFLGFSPSLYMVYVILPISRRQSQIMWFHPDRPAHHPSNMNEKLWKMRLYAHLRHPSPVHPCLHHPFRYPIICKKAIFSHEKISYPNLFIIAKLYTSNQIFILPWDM